MLWSSVNVKDLFLLKENGNQSCLLTNPLLVMVNWGRLDNMTLCKQHANSHPTTCSGLPDAITVSSFTVGLDTDTRGSLFTYVLINIKIFMPVSNGFCGL